jgi:hypothetical protein
VGDRVVVAPLANGDWRSGWRVYVDANNNGSFEAGDTALQVFNALPAGMLAQSSANFALDGGQFVSFNAFAACAQWHQLRRWQCAIELR